MSKEFGEGTLFFHEKIRQAYEDTIGSNYKCTQLMGGILKVLAPLADSVSSLEAGDTGTDASFTSELFNSLDKISQWKFAVEEYVEAAGRVAVQKSADVLEPYVKITFEEDIWKIELPKVVNELAYTNPMPGLPWKLSKEVYVELVRRHLKRTDDERKFLGKSLLWCSGDSSEKGRFECVTFYNSKTHVRCLSEENESLRKKIALLRIQIEANKLQQEKAND